MAFFDCIVGGSGKGNTVTVTCAEEFAELTITLAKTGKTYTKTCPSTAPYVVTFYGVENGTYTVSCTVDGETYSETVIVQDISCVLNYGFNWKLWVDTASQLDSSDYDTLDEVLADEKALRELFLEHACVDYMASVVASNEDLETVINNDYCAKWINNSDYALDFLGANTVIKALMDTADKYGYGEWVITDDTTTPPTWGPKGNVPVMTANNAPYGTAGATTTYSSTYDAFHAFDGVTGINTISWSAGSTANAIIYYKFTNPICPRRFLLLPEKTTSSSVSTKTWDIVGSNDGSNWEVLYSGENEDEYEEVIDNIENDNYYLYVGARIKTSYRSNSYSVSKLQFYGRELKDTPLMNADVTASGEAIASTEYSTGNEAYKVFDYSTTTLWASGSSDKSNAWIGYKFKYPVKCNAFRLATYSGRTFATVYVEGSNDEEIWETLNGGSAISVTGAQISSGGTASAFFTFTNDNKYTCYRLRTATQVSSSYNCNVYYLDFFAPDYSEKEFEAGTTKKWLYDHGVELETFDWVTEGTGVTMVKEDSQIVINDTSTSYAGVIFVDSSGVTSDYSLLRLKIGNKDIFNDTYMIVKTSKEITANNYGAVSITSSNAPNNFGLDVSNINSGYVGVNASSRGATGKISISEWWLE